MPRHEPTDESRIRSLVREELRHVAPRIGVVERAYPYTSDDAPSNYRVDLRIAEFTGGGSNTDTGDGDESTSGPSSTTGSGSVLHGVPVSVTSPGAGRGLQPDDLVLVEFRRANRDLPIVTRVFYDDSEAAPYVERGDYRRTVGDAVIEIITGDDGGQHLNIGRQGADHEGIEMGLSMNLDDGSISLLDGSEKGLAYDGDGNGLMDWESMAQPWGAAGPVNWDEDFAGYASDDSQSLLSVTVEDEFGNPLESAGVSITEADGSDDSTDDSADDATDGSTDDGSETS